MQARLGGERPEADHPRGLSQAGGSGGGWDLMTHNDGFLCLCVCVCVCVCVCENAPIPGFIPYVFLYSVLEGFKEVNRP